MDALRELQGHDALHELREHGYQRDFRGLRALQGHGELGGILQGHGELDGQLQGHGELDGLLLGHGAQHGLLGGLLGQHECHHGYQKWKMVLQQLRAGWQKKQIPKDRKYKLTANSENTNK